MCLASDTIDWAAFEPSPRLVQPRQRVGSYAQRKRVGRAFAGDLQQSEFGRRRDAAPCQKKVSLFT